MKPSTSGMTQLLNRSLIFSTILNSGSPWKSFLISESFKSGEWILNRPACLSDFAAQVVGEVYPFHQQLPTQCLVTNTFNSNSCMIRVRVNLVQAQEEWGATASNVLNNKWFDFNWRQNDPKKDCWCVAFRQNLPIWELKGSRSYVQTLIIRRLWAFI